MIRFTLLNCRIYAMIFLLISMPWPSSTLGRNCSMNLVGRSRKDPSDYPRPYERAESIGAAVYMRYPAIHRLIARTRCGEREWLAEGRNAVSSAGRRHGSCHVPIFSEGLVDRFWRLGGYIQTTEIGPYVFMFLNQ